MKKLKILLSISLIACSCQRYAKDISYTIEADTLDYIPTYSQYGFYEDEQDNIYFYCKPMSCDSLLVYSLLDSTWTLYKYLKIPEVYSDTVDMDYSVRRWALVNMDTVIAYANYKHFTFLDIKNNSVIQSIPIIADTAFDVRSFNPMQWNKHRGTLGLMFFGLKDTGDIEMMSEYSPSKGLKVFSLKYPREIMDTYLMDYGCEPYTVFFKDTLVVAFQNSPLMYCYDIKTQKTTRLFLKNKYYTPLPKLDTTRYSKIGAPNFLYEIHLVNYFYNSLVYDHHKEVYYRFFSNALPLENDEGFFNTWDDKVFGVNLIDKNFNIIGDVCFQPHDCRHIYYPTKKGLYHAYQYDEYTEISLLTFKY